MRLIRKLSGLVLSLMVAQGAMAVENEPSAEDVLAATEFVQQLADATITSLSDDTLTDSVRRSQFDELIERGFAAEYISKVVIGRYWRKMDPDQRSEYLFLFRTFILDSLMSRLSLFNDEYLNILGHNFTKKGDVFILSQIVMKSEAFDVDWRVRKMKGEYKIIDVRLEGISMVITSHEEVTGIAFTDGVEGLLNSLRERIETESSEPLVNSTLQY